MAKCNRCGTKTGFLSTVTLEGYRVINGVCEKCSSSPSKQVPVDDTVGTGKTVPVANAGTGPLSLGVIALVLILLASIARQWVGSHGGTDMLSSNSRSEEHTSELQSQFHL